MKFSLSKTENGFLFSPELNRLMKREGYEVEGIDATFLDAKGNGEIHRVGYPMPPVSKVGDDFFYLAEIWVTLDDKLSVQELVVVYDTTTRTPKIARRVDH